MLMAILYQDDDQILAAAPACDQFAMGQEYWAEVHPVDLERLSDCETGYVNVSDPRLRSRLMKVGIDQAIDAVMLQRLLDLRVAPEYAGEDYLTDRAA